MMEEQEGPYHEVRDSFSTGRGCFATRIIKAGDEICCCDPLVTAVAPSWRSYVCHYCMTSTYPKRNKEICDGCKAGYCSPECREGGAVKHTAEACQASSNLLSRFHDQDEDENAWTANAAALILQAFSCLDASLWQSVYALCSLEASDLDPELAKDLEDITALVETCLNPEMVDKVLAIVASSPSSSAAGMTTIQDIIHTLLLRSECNAFSYWSTDVDHDQLGMGLFLEAAMFNHNCMPSIAKMLDSRRLRFFALRDIAPEEALYISYVPVHYEVKARREVLSKHFHFDCLCERCVIEGMAHDEVEEGEGEEALLPQKHVSAQQKIIKALVHSECGGVWIPPKKGSNHRKVICSLCKISR